MDTGKKIATVLFLAIWTFLFVCLREQKKQKRIGWKWIAAWVMLFLFDSVLWIRADNVSIISTLLLTIPSWQFAMYNLIRNRSKDKDEAEQPSHEPDKGKPDDVQTDRIN